MAAEELNEVKDEKDEGVQEAEAEEKQTEETEDKQERPQVPLPHLLRERQLRQQYESQVKQLEERLKQLEEGKAPEYDEDPKAYIDHKTTPKESLTRDEVQQMLRNQMVEHQLNQDISATRKKHKDYDDALNHVRNVLFNQNLLSGLPEEKAWNAVLEGEMQMAQSFLARGESPSEAVYDYAKTIGYKGRQKKPEKDKIDTIKEGKESSTPAGGGDSHADVVGDANRFDQIKKEAFAFMKKR